MILATIRPQRVLLRGLLALVLLGAPASVSAAYPPGPFPGPGPAGGFPTIVTSQTVGSTGATITVGYGGATITLVVPPGAFSTDIQLTIYASDPAIVGPLVPTADKLLLAFAVGWTPALVAAIPLTLTVTDPAIPPDAMVFVTGPGGLTPYPAQVSAGSVRISFTTDPGFVVVRPKVSPTRVTVVDAIAAGVNRGTAGFGTGSVVVAAGGYITYLVHSQPSLAGRTIAIWTRTKTGPWHLLAARLAAADGTVHYYARVHAWTAFQARFAGDATLSPADSHGRIATVLVRRAAIRALAIASASEFGVGARPRHAST